MNDQSTDQPPTPAEILLKAAEVIETNGHHKGDFWSALAIDEARRDGDFITKAQCPVCAYGAINLVTTGDPDDINYLGADTVAELAEYLGIEDSIRGVARWNDAHTAEQVTAALRERATELAR